MLYENGTATTLATFAGPLREAGLRPVVELTGTAPDGYPVHGWLVLPEGPGPHPVVLCVHGGPFMYYNWGFFDEAQMYASAGYAVVLGNPRGSAGYGQEHGKAIVRALGTVDADDVLALLDAALARPECDAEPGRRDGRLVRRLHDQLAGRAPRRTGSGPPGRSARSTRGTRSPAVRTSAGRSPRATSGRTRRSSAGAAR